MITPRHKTHSQSIIFRRFRMGLSVLLLLSGAGLAAIPLANFKSVPAVQAPAQGAMQLVSQKNASAARATYAAESAEVVLRAERRGFPLLNLRDGKRMRFGPRTEPSSFLLRGKAAR